MHITLAGNTSLSYSCLEKLCRSGMNPDAVIVPRKNAGEYSHMTDFSSLAGEFGFQLIRLSQSANNYKEIQTDLLIKLEWPASLILPVNASLATIGSNLGGQYDQGKLVDIAADILTGNCRSEIQLVVENKMPGENSRNIASPGNLFPAVLDYSELEINLFDDIRSVKAKAAGKISKMLHNLLSKLNVDKNPPDPIDREFIQKVAEVNKDIDWCEPAGKIYNLIRSLTHPGPGAYTFYEGEKLGIWRGHFFEKTNAKKESANAGTVTEIIAELGVLVTVADGLFLITRVQSAGSPELPAWVWAHDSRVHPGDRLEKAAGNVEIVPDRSE
jgi:methionyl-tRNA formyltransferase